MRRIYFIVYSFLLSIFFIVIFFRPITSINEDLGRHILLGEIILKNLSVPKINLLSYTFPDFHFINTTWLSAVIFYFAKTIGGYNLLLILNLSVAFSACYLQFAYVKKYSSFFPVVLGAVIYLVLLSFRTDVRPEVFSMLFVSIFLISLKSFVEKPTAKILLLIPAQIVWTNLQIYFIVGPLLIFFFLINEIFSKKSKQRTAKMTYLIILFFGCLVGTIFNPHGIMGASYPFFVFQNYGLSITENQNIFMLFRIYNNSALILPILIVTAACIGIYLAKIKIKLLDISLFVIFTLLMVLNFRNVLLFIFGTFIPFVFLVDAFWKKYSKKLKKLPHTFFIYINIFFVLIILIIILRSIQIRSVGFGIVDRGKLAVDYIIENNIVPPYYNDFNIGSYLSSRIYPTRVFVDGRPEAYPSEFFVNTYLPMQSDPNIFKKLDNTYNFNSIIVSHFDGSANKNTLLKFLIEKSNFSLVYLDSYALVLVKNNEKNKAVIARDYINRKSISSEKEFNAKRLIAYILLFSKLGWDDKGKETFRQLQKVDPNLCILKDYPNIKLYRLPFIKSEAFDKCGVFRL